MASTYSPRLKLELIASGEQANSWGDTTNSTLQKSIDESISGVYSVNLGSASSPRNLSNTQGGSATADGEWRQAALRFYGHTTAFVIRQQDVGSTKERIYTIINKILELPLFYRRLILILCDAFCIPISIFIVNPKIFSKKYIFWSKTPSGSTRIRPGPIPRPWELPKDFAGINNFQIRGVWGGL